MKSAIPIYDIQNLIFYKNDGILVSRFGPYAEQQQHLHSAHRHSFYHLVFFTEGTGKQQIDFNTFEVKPGLIYFMIPGQVHSWDFDTKPDGYIINFSSNYLSSFLLKPDYLENFNFFKGMASDQVMELDDQLQQRITAIFEDILKEGQSEEPIDDDLVKSLLITLLIAIDRSANRAQESVKSPSNVTLLKNFKDLIESNFTKLRMPKQYAELLHITPNHLNSLCNTHLDVSAGMLIRKRIILEAKRLLINLDLLVAEIAGKLNFDDQSYFIKFFKKYEGITPEKFRKLNTTQNERYSGN